MNKRRRKYICLYNCSRKREDIGDILSFYKNQEYIVYESSINNLYVYTIDNKVVGSVDNNFLTSNFRIKSKDEEILKEVDDIFEKIIFG